MLLQLLLDLGMRPLQSDEQLFIWHDGTEIKGGSDALDPSVFAPSCKLVLSTHVDDLKGAGQPEYR